LNGFLVNTHLHNLSHFMKSPAAKSLYLHPPISATYRPKNYNDLKIVLSDSKLNIWQYTQSSLKVVVAKLSLIWTGTLGLSVRKNERNYAKDHLLSSSPRRFDLASHSSCWWAKNSNQLRLFKSHYRKSILILEPRMTCSLEECSGFHNIKDYKLEFNKVSRSAQPLLRQDPPITAKHSSSFILEESG
jgi:hypothetical protein